MNTSIRRIIVHNGTFHADDVLCVAMVQLINPDVVVDRMSRSQLPDDMVDDTIVADIGCGKYDHHQINAKLRDDGKKYAACGLLLQDLEYALFGTSAPPTLIEHIRQIEDYDNKVPESKEDFLSRFVRLCNPEWDDDVVKMQYDKLFEDTVAQVRDHFLKPYIYDRFLSETNKLYFSTRILELAKKHDLAEQRASTAILKALQESNGYVVILHSRLPWYNFLIPSSALFVINPSNRGGFHLQCIPKQQGSNVFKQLLPVSWLTEPPSGCDFVHNRLFIASFSNCHDAVKAAYDITI